MLYNSNAPHLCQRGYPQMVNPLSTSDFLGVVKNTPLVSIDLVIADRTGAILMGWRQNEPAKDTWFVPGGRIQKDERISDAFERILSIETGLQASFSDARFANVFEHFYPANCFGDPAFGTHYCVLAYILQFHDRPVVQIDHQHSKIEWLTASATNIHRYSKAYFEVLNA
jgi:colanic acid biosynthesis protein WcaH